MSRQTNSKPPLIVIVGPNASGKTALSIKLAKKFNGEIISADSRQVYRGMDLGTAKATISEQREIRHHLLDIMPPSREFNVTHFKKYALQAIGKIHSQHKLPFLVGGSGFWIQAVVDDLDLPQVKPNKLLRRQLAKKTTQELFRILKKFDPRRAKNIDKKNPYRLIRAIEIVKATKKPVPVLNKTTPFNTLIIGLKLPLKTLYKRIDGRLEQRFKQGMVAEVKKLHKQGVSWQRLYNFGLEYRYISLYLRGRLSSQDMKEQLRQASHHYAKRQLTWWRKDKRIHWINSAESAEKLVVTFLKK